MSTPNPRDWSAAIQAARAELERGRLGPGFELLQRAVELGPQEALVWNERGLFQYARGFYAEALTDFSRAVELSPENPAVRVNRALALRRLQRPREALAELDAALVADPEQSVAPNPANPSSASNPADASTASPASLHGERARCLEELDDPAAALAAADQAVALAPEDSEYAALRGRLRLENGQRAEAFADLERAMELAPDRPEACAEHARALERLDDLDRALASRARAVELAPPDRAGRFLLERGALLLRMGRLPEAAADFERCLELSPGEPRLFLERGKLFLKNAEYPRAGRNLERTVALLSGSQQSETQQSNALGLEARLCQAQAALCAGDPPTARIALDAAAPLAAETAELVYTLYLQLVLAEMTGEDAGPLEATYRDLLEQEFTHPYDVRSMEEWQRAARRDGTISEDALLRIEHWTAGVSRRQQM